MVAKTKHKPMPVPGLELDGPHPTKCGCYRCIQTRAHTGLRAPPGLPSLPGVVTYREPLVEKADWKDPADVGVRARNYGARDILGWKRVWIIDTLHRGSPKEITKAHVGAATRLLRDYELGVEGARQVGLANDRVDNSSPAGISAAQLDALKRYREATEAIGQEAATIVSLVAIHNWTISRLGVYLGIHRDRAHGRFYAGIERLREHYLPPKEQRAEVRPYGQAPEPERADDSGGLAVERIGRWRAPGMVS